jgi:prepilin-type N-terminal cleavage/methylation domain-containing protein
MKQRGFTLIEAAVAVVILTVVGALVARAVNVIGSGYSITYGALGMTESRCIENYKFIMDQQGNSRQILDELGKGVRCEQASRPGSMQ